MNRSKIAWLSYVLPAVTVLALVVGYASHGEDAKPPPQNQLCKHQYALCTAAPCVPQPGDPTKAVCSCVVEEGLSMSTAPCSTLQPSTDANGIRTVYSEFSLVQFAAGQEGMKCPSGTPWTWCLNKICTVNPLDPKKAMCVCDVKHTGEWMTAGGGCDTSTCKTGYWSGAPIQDFESGNDFMTKALGLKKSPAKWCPQSK